MASFALAGLALLFFFIRNAYANYLVGSKKRSPNNASTAAWSLFGGFLFASAIACVAIADSSLMTLPLIASLATLSVICFVLSIAITSKK